MIATQLFKKGDILYSVWGYDQTNIDYFQVVKATEKSVWIREIDKKKTYKGHMHGSSLPIKDQFLSWSLLDKENKPVRRTIKNPDWASKPYINIKGYNSASLWDGKPHGFSEWA